MQTHKQMYWGEKKDFCYYHISRLAVFQENEIMFFIDVSVLHVQTNLKS